MDNVIVMILIAAISGGSGAPFAKVALEVFGPFTLLVIRFLSTALVLLPFVHRSRELNGSVFKHLLGVKLIGSLNPILLFIGLQFTTASVSPLIYAAVPLMTAIYFRAARNSRIAARSLQGIVVGFLGVAIIFLLPLFEKGTPDLSSLWGNVLILGAAVVFMFYGIVSKERQRRLKVSPLALTFYLSVVTLLVSLPFSVFELLRQPLVLSAVQPKHLLSAVALGIVSTSMFYISYQRALQLGNEVTASLYTYLQPVSTILLAWLMLGETLTVPFVLGGALAVIGAGMASQKAGAPVAAPKSI